METKLDFEKMWDTDMKSLAAQMAHLPSSEAEWSFKFNAQMIFKTYGRLEILGAILGKKTPIDEMAEALKKAGASDEVLASFGKS